jgi:hypothetical protein
VVRAAGCSALLLLASACNAAAGSQILVEVSSDLLVPDEIDRVVVTAVSPEERSQSATADLGPTEIPLPRVLSMVHTDSGALGPYLLTIRGERRGSSVVERRASVSFQPGRTLVLRVELRRDCVGVSCDDEMTCAVGGCRSIDVSPGELSEWNGQQPPQDAAAFDSCVEEERCNGVDDNCNGEIDEGFDLENDPDNCGGCGVACSDVNTPRACSEGRCVLTCEAPFESCDGDVLNGCETNVLTDRSHCGRCGNACTGNRSCCNGTCGNC